VLWNDAKISSGPARPGNHLGMVNCYSILCPRGHRACKEAIIRNPRHNQYLRPAAWGVRLNWSSGDQGRYLVILADPPRRLVKGKVGGACVRAAAPVRFFSSGFVDWRFAIAWLGLCVLHSHEGRGIDRKGNSSAIKASNRKIAVNPPKNCLSNGLRDGPKTPA